METTIWGLGFMVSAIHPCHGSYEHFHTTPVWQLVASSLSEAFSKDLALDPNQSLNPEF